jgi:hypothetical protein
MRSIILRSVVASLAIAAPISAATIASAATPSAGKPTSLTFKLDASGPPVSGRIPSGLGFSAPGFTFDSRAVVKFCSHELAILNECPPKSEIGKGTLLVHVVSPTFTRNTAIQLTMYLRSRRGIFAVAFIGGPKVVPGKLTTAGGVSLNFNPLPSLPPFPGVTVTLERINVKVGTSRVVVTRSRQRVHGKLKTVVKRTRYSLIHQPKTCTGSWSDTINLAFAGAPSTTSSTPLACPKG